MMISENSGIDSKVIVENEKQVITIGNNSRTTEKTTRTIEKTKRVEPPSGSSKCPYFIENSNKL